MAKVANTAADAVHNSADALRTREGANINKISQAINGGKIPANIVARAASIDSVIGNL
jgi:hypothetical protein